MNRKDILLPFNCIDYKYIYKTIDIKLLLMELLVQYQNSTHQTYPKPILNNTISVELKMIINTCT